MLILTMNRSIFSALAACVLAISSALAQERTPDQVVRVPNSDRDMIEAIANAQATLDEFLVTWKASPTGTSGFKLKVRIQDEGKSEHFWVAPFREDGERFVGILANSPKVVKNVKEGQAIRFSRVDISDWGYVKDGKQVGSFTVCALFKIMPKAQADAYRRDYGFTC